MGIIKAIVIIIVVVLIGLTYYCWGFKDGRNEYVPLRCADIIRVEKVLLCQIPLQTEDDQLKIYEEK